MNAEKPLQTSSPDALRGTVSGSLETSESQSFRRRRRSTTSRGPIFHYKPLDRSKGSVRLIRVFPLRQNDFIRCRIERHHISTTSYVALSYVWGSQEAKCEILLNGQIFRLRSNLFAFLKYLAKTAYSTDTLFWIDAICIDQTNVAEKNHHISHIGTIYRHATKVISWLGNSSFYALSGKEPPGQWICCESFSRDKDAGRRHRCEWRIPYSASWGLLRHEYWSRLWVAQELSLARRVDILYRNRYYSWSQITKCLSKNMSRVREIDQRFSPQSSFFFGNMNYLGSLPVARYLKPTVSAPLGDLMLRFASHACRVGHDHAFALLSMASDGEYFEPDYDEQCISLLFRLMTFFKTSPTASFTGKIGTALGLRPSTAGIAVKTVGSPVVSETIGNAGTYFRIMDRIPGPLEVTDHLIQIPDTNLYILCREKPSDDAEMMYTALARVNAVSLRVEHGRQKFTNSQQSSANHSFSTTPLSESSVWKNIAFRKNPQTNSFSMLCDWQTVLFIFDHSRTQSMPGRLESRIREWLHPQDLSMEDCQTFIVNKAADQRTVGKHTIPQHV